MTEAVPAAPEHLASPTLYRPDASACPHIDRGEVLRYLGYTGQDIDGELAARIERIECNLEHDIAPRGIWRAFPVDARGTDASGNPCIRLVGTTVELQGRDIFRHLKDATSCVLLACTLGMESERRLRALGGQNPLDATVLDAAASAYIEAAVDQMDALIGQAARESGLSRNRRFSCGYGDCPIEAQDAIAAALDATRRIGLTVTPTHLLLPSKSVTAMIGLFEGAAPAADARPSCANCRVAGACAFRERGTTCY